MRVKIYGFYCVLGTIVMALPGQFLLAQTPLSSIEFADTSNYLPLSDDSGELRYIHLDSLGIGATSDSSRLSIQDSTLLIGGASPITMTAEGDRFMVFYDETGNRKVYRFNAVVPVVDEQNISRTGDIVSVSNGGSIDLSDYNTPALDTIWVDTLYPNLLNIAKNNGVNYSIEIFDCATFDAQQLSFANNIVTLDRGGSIDLSILEESQALQDSFDALITRIDNLIDQGATTQGVSSGNFFALVTPQLILDNDSLNVYGNYDNYIDLSIYNDLDEISDTATVLRSYIDGQLVWTDNGVNEVYVPAGYQVGIGTTNPDAPLHIESGSGGDDWLFRSGGTDILELAWRENNTDRLVMQLDGVNDNFDLSLNGSSRLRVDGNGNVGIGTSSPSAQLHITDDFKHAIWTTEHFNDQTQDDGWLKIAEYATTSDHNHIANIEVEVTISDFQGGVSQTPSVGKLVIVVAQKDGVAKSKAYAEQFAGGYELQEMIRVVDVGSNVHEIQVKGQRNTSKWDRYVWTIRDYQKVSSAITLTKYSTLQASGTDTASGNATYDAGLSIYNHDVSFSKNVGIGTTAPSAPLTIGNNVASGALDNDSEYQIMLYDGSSATASYGLGIRSSTLVLNSANTLDIDIAGTPELRVTSAKTQFFGMVESNTHVVSGYGSGGVALSINDGKGNANITFNHLAGVPEQSGNAARIEVNTDGNTNSQIHFELQSGVTGGVNTNLENIFSLYDDSPARLWKYGDGNLTGSETYLLGVEEDGDLVEVDPTGFGGGGSSSRTWSFDMHRQLSWSTGSYSANNWVYYINGINGTWSSSTYKVFGYFKPSYYGLNSYFDSFKAVPFDCTCTMKPSVLRNTSNNRNVQFEIFKVSDYTITGTSSNESSIISGYGSIVSYTSVTNTMNVPSESSSFTMNEGDFISVRWKSSNGASNNPKGEAYVHVHCTEN